MTHLTSVELTTSTMTAAIAVRHPAIVRCLRLLPAKRPSFPSTRACRATRLEHPISANTGTGVSGMISRMEEHRRLGGIRVAVDRLDPRTGWDSAGSWIMRGGCDGRDMGEESGNDANLPNYRRRVERQESTLSIWPPSPKEPYKDEECVFTLINLIARDGRVSDLSASFGRSARPRGRRNDPPSLASPNDAVGDTLTNPSPPKWIRRRTTGESGVARTRRDAGAMTTRRRLKGTLRRKSAVGVGAGRRTGEASATRPKTRATMSGVSGGRARVGMRTGRKSRISGSRKVERWCLSRGRRRLDWLACRRMTRMRTRSDHDCPMSRTTRSVATRRCTSCRCRLAASSHSACCVTCCR
jgi:hypothetical protein